MLLLLPSTFWLLPVYHCIRITKMDRELLLRKLSHNHLNWFHWMNNDGEDLFREVREILYRISTICRCFADPVRIRPYYRPYNFHKYYYYINFPFGRLDIWPLSNVLILSIPSVLSASLVNIVFHLFPSFSICFSFEFIILLFFLWIFSFPVEYCICSCCSLFLSVALVIQPIYLNFQLYFVCKIVRFSWEKRNKVKKLFRITRNKIQGIKFHSNTCICVRQKNDAIYYKKIIHENDSRSSLIRDNRTIATRLLFTFLLLNFCSSSLFIDCMQYEHEYIFDHYAMASLFINRAILFNDVLFSIFKCWHRLEASRLQVLNVLI